MGMFCYQCEQTAGGTGCTKMGVCGKTDDVAALQDAIIEVAKGIAQYAHAARALGAKDVTVDRFVVEALFTTVTNVDFDPARLEALLLDGVKKRTAARELLVGAGGDADSLAGAATYDAGANRAAMEENAAVVGITARKEKHGETPAGLQELILYGLKGTAAYADHARVLGQEDDAVYAKFNELMAFLAEESEDIDALLGNALATGELNFRVMELLDAANTGTYGHPVPTPVSVTPVAGKAILVSGHDLKDLKMLLEQTEGKGVNIFTHGEMLPAHGYPELKKHAHLVGNYGGAWQDQRKEFDAFPGAILMTTNCIQKPKDEYQSRIYTTGLVAWPGVEHIDADADGNKDFSAVINAALAADGFAEDGAAHDITVGFGREAVLGVAGPVIDAVKAGALRHFFLVGGCDGAKPGRNYYTELAEQIPDDCVILTLACGKFRFNKMDFGDIGGIPRLLDIGQCNDSYSAIRIALALAEAFDCGVNDLPLSLVLSWYEQKAIAVLLTLLHLGVENIRVGPTLPAFVTEPVLNVLVEKFKLAPISTPEEDLKAILG